MMVSFLYIALMIFYFALHSIFGLFKILHVLIVLKEKLVCLLAPYSMRHVNFLLTKQVGAHPLYVYFLDSGRGVGPSLT